MFNIYAVRGSIRFEDLLSAVWFGLVRFGSERSRRLADRFGSSVVAVRFGSVRFAFFLAKNSYSSNHINTYNFIHYTL
jgi:hypothetical protein